MEKNGNVGTDLRSQSGQTKPKIMAEKYRKLKLIQIEANADYKVNQALHDFWKEM